MMDVDFSGSAVVVTGGAGGIGRAIAEACAAAGARVAVLDVKHEETASLLEELPGEGHLCVTGDAGVEEDVRFLRKSVGALRPGGCPGKQCMHHPPRYSFRLLL